MTRFLTALLGAAATSDRGMTTGEPGGPARRAWSEVHEQARQAAGSLVTVGGVAPGEAVAVLAAEPVQIAPAAQAVWLAGGSVTMLHQPTARTDLPVWAAETVRVLKMIGAGLVLLGPPFDPLAGLLREHGVGFLMLDELAGGPPLATPVEVDESATALLQLTSGSTAAPKAVQITHANLYANLSDMAAASGLDPALDVLVSWLPLFHDMGMVGFLTLPMTVGAELVSVTPSDFRSRPLLWPELISRYRGTLTAAPNFAYAVAARQLAHAEPGSLDLSSMRFALNGAEPIDPDAVAAFVSAGAPFGLRPECMVAAYGMAEATLAVSFAPLGCGLEVDRIDAEQLEAHHRAVPVGAPVPDRPTRRFPLLGPPLPGLEVRVVDEAKVLSEREVGVLQVRGEAVTARYLTVAGPVSTLDEEGWLDTGDLGYLVAGQVVVCGRVKDVIIMGGRNVFPTDVERAASTVDGVRAGNAVAVRLTAGERLPGERGATRRETFLVVVESRRAGDPDAEREVRRQVNAAVVSAVGVRPAEVVILAPGSLPKTPSGKLRRTATRELLRR